MTTRTPVQRLRRFIRDIRHDLRQCSSLSVRDALLVRLGYVISYCLLLFYEVISVAVWLSELPKPPRALLGGAVAVVLAVLWALGL